MKEINEILLNPIRMRIIQELATKSSITTNELCENINDVPRTTMYRHINILIKNNILKIISEKKVRGSLERTLALNVEELKNKNSKENAIQNTFGFLMNKYTKFYNYFNKGGINPANDKIFLNNSVLMMSDEEYDHFLLELRDLIIKYNFEVNKERKIRDISIISAPVEENHGNN